MGTQFVIHEQSREYIYPVDRNRVTVRIKVMTRSVSEAYIYYFNRNKKEEGIIDAQMKCYARDNTFDYYEYFLVTEKATRYINYYFHIIDRSGNEYWYNYYGTCNTQPEGGFFEYSYTNDNDIFKVPAWTCGAVFYQIFPERFCNGDPGNDPESTEEWPNLPTRNNFFGGDLKGILDKLDYLKQLGVDVLYLNPIFEAPSNHKYDTINYYKIDPHFGTLEDHLSLVQACHEKGMKIILDGVFNHCGYEFTFFQDVVRNGEKSKYKDWFYIDAFPIDMEKLNYETIGYYKYMPKLKLSNPEVAEYFTDIACFWISKTGIDGWRLDVAEEVDYTFWQQLRKSIKTLNKSCFMLAETWRQNRDMLRGDQMDSVMNYPFMYAVIAYFASGKIDSMEFDSRINKFIGVYPEQAYNSLFNIVGSHDTMRLLTACNNNKGRMMAAVAFQMLFCGIPVIFYGDEIGLDGGNDPECRKTMEWDSERQDLELLKWYKKMIDIRKNNEAIQKGRFKTNYCCVDNKVYGFFREYEGKRAYVVINSGETQETIEMPILEPYQFGKYLMEEVTGVSCKVHQKGDYSYYNNDIYNYFSCVKLNLMPYQVYVLLN